MAYSDRTTAGLTGRNVATIWDAVTHAERIGRPLNMHLTAHWDNVDNPAGLTIQTRHGQLRERMQKWLYRRGLALCDVWVIERGSIAEGLHVHQVPHIPAEYQNAFAAMVPQWIGVPAGDLDGAKKHTIARSIDGVWQLDKRYDASTKLFQYILKGFQRGSEQPPYGIMPKNAGIITGKRSGAANSLLPAARRKWEAKNARG